MAHADPSAPDSIRLQLSDIEVRPRSTRQTPDTGFRAQLARGLSGSARAVSGIAKTAGYQVPAAAVLGAAVNGIGAERDVEGYGGQALAGLSAGAEGGAGGPLASVWARAAGGDRAAELMAATQQMQELNQQFNVQMLQLQEHCQRDSRQFTAISNVMKVKHDTARNALSNLK